MLSGHCHRILFHRSLSCRVLYRFNSIQSSFTTKDSCLCRSFSSSSSSSTATATTSSSSSSTAAELRERTKKLKVAFRKLPNIDILLQFYRRYASSFTPAAAVSLLNEIGKRVIYDDRAHNVLYMNQAMQEETTEYGSNPVSPYAQGKFERLQAPEGQEVLLNSNQLTGRDEFIELSQYLETCLTDLSDREFVTLMVAHGSIRDMLNPLTTLYIKETRMFQFTFINPKHTHTHTHTHTP